MTRHIAVGPPDTSQVYTGTLWRMRRDAPWGEGFHMLVLTAITDEVFNVAWWPEREEPLHTSHTTVSILGADVLAATGKLIAEPLPELLDMIDQAMGPGLGAVDDSTEED